MEQTTSDIIAIRREKVRELREAGRDPYPNDFRVTHAIGDILSLLNDSDGTPDPLPAGIASAGRIMAINRFGKSCFIRFRDRTGQLQAYIRHDKVGEDAYALFKKMDIGDFIGITGEMFQTKTGEWTLLANKIRMLAKSLRPLPEKFHGLKDPEKRYRQRYLDLIMNPEVRDLFVKRSRLIQVIRNFLLERDFLEVETPMMQTIPGGAEARPFKTHHNALDMDLYLRIAPELYLKRLVAGGFERVFEINRNFRNEGISTQHNPEFTMVEFYQAYADYRDLMALTEEMFQAAAMAVTGSIDLGYQGNIISFKSPWRQMTMHEALETIGGIDPAVIHHREGLLEAAASAGVTFENPGELRVMGQGKILTKLFDALVEPRLIQPTFITGYPVEVSPLSRRSRIDANLTDRFELFIAGREIANGFSELNDPEDQRDRFLQQLEKRAAGDDESHMMDEDYIRALEYGMPPAAGEGIGIDRLAMLLTDAASIRDVILFPHMKPTDKV